MYRLVPVFLFLIMQKNNFRCKNKTSQRLFYECNIIAYNLHGLDIFMLIFLDIS